MIEEIAIAVGLVAVIEGLVLALAPQRVEDALRIIAGIPLETRRTVGLAAVAVGVLVVWAGRAFLS